MHLTTAILSTVALFAMLVASTPFTVTHDGIVSKRDDGECKSQRIVRGARLFYILIFHADYSETIAEEDQVTDDSPFSELLVDD